LSARRKYNEAVLDRVRNTIRRHSMLSAGQRVGVAVSGGADSVCLLHLLREIAPEMGVTLTVLHLNHRLRGAESDEDEGFVAGLAREFGVELHAASVDVAALGSNLEQAGREARRRFFAGLRASGAVDRVATGHTRSDQAETVLYRLLRGSGTAGLSGILPVTAEGVVRPLIECSRDEVLGYLRERNLPWREDSTNASREFVRNRIRHELIPAITRDFNPAASEVLAATADVARDEEDYWTAETGRIADALFQRKGGVVIVNTRELFALHPAVQRRVIRRAMAEVKGDLRGIDISHVEGVLSIARQTAGHGRIQTPGLDIIRSFNLLRVAAPRSEGRSSRDYCFTVPDNACTRLQLPGASAAICLDFHGESEQGSRPDGYNERIGEVDADCLTGPLELRNWHPGDEFERTPGSPERIKLLFQEARVPLWDRQTWPVIVSGDRIVWTRRFGVAASVRKTAGTRRFIRVYELETEC
jgi:tRNA(Ile)-lysidine synthase